MADHGESPRTRLDTSSDHQPVPRFEHMQRTRYRRESVGTYEHWQVRTVVFMLHLRFPVYHPHQTVLGVLQTDHFVNKFHCVFFTHRQALKAIFTCFTMRVHLRTGRKKKRETDYSP